MNEKIAKKWAAALRSGKYEQGTGQLRDGGRFCCLGVLCNLHAQAHPEIAATQTMSRFYLGAITALPQEVVDWAGMDSELGVMAGGNMAINEHDSLAEANDDGVSFKTIADFISKHHDAL